MGRHEAEDKQGVDSKDASIISLDFVLCVITVNGLAKLVLLIN